MRALASLQFAAGTIPLDPPSGPLHTIYVGASNQLEKYMAITGRVRQLLRFPNPFDSVRAKPLVTLLPIML